MGFKITIINMFKKLEKKLKRISYTFKELKPNQ